MKAISGAEFDKLTKAVQTIVKSEIEQLHTQINSNTKETIEGYLSSDDCRNRFIKWTHHAIEEYNDDLIKKTMDVEKVTEHHHKELRETFRFANKYYKRCQAFWKTIYTKAVPYTAWTVFISLMLYGIVHFIIVVSRTGAMP